MNRTKLLQNPRPMDRVASRVVYGKAEHWTPMRLNGVVFDDIPPLANVDARHSILLHPGFEDLAGRQCGRLVALGLYAEDPLSKKHRFQDIDPDNARWVCRCPCGCYVLRRASVIKANLSRVMQCGRCERKRKLRAPYHPGMVRADEDDA